MSQSLFQESKPNLFKTGIMVLLALFCRFQNGCMGNTHKFLAVHQLTQSLIAFLPIQTNTIVYVYYRVQILRGTPFMPYAVKSSCKTGSSSGNFRFLTEPKAGTPKNYFAKNRSNFKGTVQRDGSGRK